MPRGESTRREGRTDPRRSDGRRSHPPLVLVKTTQGPGGELRETQPRGESRPASRVARPAGGGGQPERSSGRSVTVPNQPKICCCRKKMTGLDFSAIIEGPTTKLCLNIVFSGMLEV